MRYSMIAMLAATSALFASPAFAELQNVEVGGEIRIRWNHFSPEAVAGQVRPGIGLFNIGNPLGAQFNEEGNSLNFVEQRTRLNVTADFTKDVTAFIEIDSYDWFGEDFRAEYITSLNRFANTNDDIEIYQAYIETRDTWGVPLRMRVGRQEMQFGSEWLVGNNDTSSFFSGLSFDGITLAYDTDMFTITAFATILEENSPIEEDSDVNFYGIYGSYHGIEDVSIDAYYLFLRDGRGSRLGFPFDTPNVGLFGRIANSIERVFGVDQYDETQKIHTFGLRGAGVVAGFDWEAEVAYQIGDAPNTVRAFFSPDPNSFLTGPAFLPFGGPYGDDDAEYDAWAANIEVGYTFDAAIQPRVYLGAAYFEGEDNREDTFREWLRNLFPFYTQDASISFNRLFSDWEYSEFLADGDLSNAIVFRGGLSLAPTETVEVLLTGAYFLADETFTSNGVLGFPFLGYESDDELGWELGLYLSYDYTEDLVFNFGYAHFFAGDGVDRTRTGIFSNLFPRFGGNFVNANGLGRVGGVSDDDADYFFAETSIRF
jgi:hypothetical protein